MLIEIEDSNTEFYIRNESCKRPTEKHDIDPVSSLFYEF